MSLRRFAAHLGVSDRTVSNWEAGGEEIEPVPESQALLDTVLERADSAARQRFREILGASAAATSPALGSFILAPSPEPALVHRSDDFENLVSVIGEASATTGTVPVAVCGPGGFGKTTLVTQVCDDPRVRELFPEILWVETGEECTAARTVQLISDLCVHLSGTRPALTDPEQAGFHLARLLQDRRALLVIDNVWSATDLAPFLLGGNDCVRVVTTRNVRVCPSATRIVRLGPMSAGEISEMLTRNVTALEPPTAAKLAGMCGGWPLLATLVGSTVSQDVEAGALPELAVLQAGDALRAEGPQAFDVWDADQRKKTIGQAIASSLSNLDSSVVINGASGLRERFLSLSVFPAAVPIPLSVVTRWWQTAYGWTPTAVRQFCRLLADRSLISGYLADPGAIAVHDVFRAYMRHMVGSDWTTHHRSLIESYRETTGGRWEALDKTHTYLWQNLPYHLHEAALDDELVEMLAFPSYVVRKVSLVGHQALVSDANVLDSLTEWQSADPPRRRSWATARSMVGAGYLLSGLQHSADVASTLAVALRRAGDADTAAALDESVGFRSRVVRPADSHPSHGHVGAVVSVASAGALIASGGEDGALRLWEPTTRRLVRTHRAHTGWIFAVALSRDGHLVASAGDDGTIRMWRADTGAVLGVLNGHSRRVRGLAFSDSGAFLVSGAEDGHVCVWDIQRMVLAGSMRTAGTPVWSVSVGRDDTVVAAVGEDEFVRLFDLRTGQLLAERAAHRDWVRATAFAPDSSTLVTGSGDRSVIVWNTAGRRLVPVRRIEDFKTRVRAVTALERSDVIIAATEEPRVHAFGVDGLVGEARMPSGVDWVRSVSRTGDGSVVLGCEDGAIRLWDPAGRGRMETLTEGSDAVWSTQLADAGRLAVVGDGSGTVELIRVSPRESTRRLRAGQGRVWSVATGGEYVAAACGDGSVRAWSWRDAQWHRVLNEDVARTWAVALGSAAPWLAASTGDGHIRCFDLPSGELVWTRDVHAGRLRSIAFDGDGDVVAACGGDGSVRVWRAETGEHVSRFAYTNGWARTVALDAAGDRAAAGFGTGEISVRDIAGDRFTAHLAGHTGRVLMLGFTDDGDGLVSAAADGTVRLWSLSEQRQIAEVRVDASIHCAGFDNATGQVLVGSSAGVVALTINAQAATDGGSR
ncbi:NB-ARC domain-containing protein [Streptantibioticus parmotrematis]|nr:NB-ARC domain-containing protein [Streptantibioticus parmotrematis]